MRRFRKPLVLASACAIALLLIRSRPEADSPARSSAYDLGQLSIFTRALFQVNEEYYDKTRFDQRRMLLGALDHLERAVPEILVDRLPERDPRQVRVRVASGERLFEIGAVDSPWSLRSTLQEIFRFVQPRLLPGTGGQETERLLAIEMAATNGVLATLDPHSALLDVDSYREMRTQTQGRFGGVGMSLIEDPRRGIVVRRLIPDTPAARAGILPRDRIVRIDNESTMNMTLSEAIERLRGEVGARVDIYVDRPGEGAVRKFTMARDMIRPSSIEDARVLTSRSVSGQPSVKIGYFQIESFSATTEADLLATLDRFEQERVRGLIMDLRDNPGGLYEQAFKVADAFIGAGTLVSMVGVGGSQRRSEVATAGGNLKLPLAVLVDGRSASASEIVAAALKNLDRGVIIGETTFGKGSVQMLFDIPAPAASPPRPVEETRLGLKLTTAQYLTPGDLVHPGGGSLAGRRASASAGGPPQGRDSHSTAEVVPSPPGVRSGVEPRAQRVPEDDRSRRGHSLPPCAAPGVRSARGRGSGGPGRGGRRARGIGRGDRHDRGPGPIGELPGLCHGAGARSARAGPIGESPADAGRVHGVFHACSLRAGREGQERARRSRESTGALERPGQAAPRPSCAPA